VYDTTKIVKYLDESPTNFLKEEEKGKPFYWNNMLWLPIYHNDGFVNSYYVKFEKLYFSLRGSELTITNSLQKFYMQNNYEAFTFSDVQKAVKKLDDCFDFSIYDAEVKKTSIAVVIGENEDNTFNNWLEYKGNKPLIMRNKAKVYGAHFKATNYNVKGYDKTYQTKTASNVCLKENFIRFELEGNARYFNVRKESIGIHKVSDLVDKTKFDALGNELLKVYDTIKKQPIIEYQNLQPKEIRLLATMSNNDCFKGLKKHHKETFKKDRIVYAKLLKTIEDSTLEKQIRDKIKNQIIYCQNN
jgi:hypothetical protein